MRLNQEYLYFRNYYSKIRFSNILFYSNQCASSNRYGHQKLEKKMKDPRLSLAINPRLTNQKRY